ncbi:MAG: hypothetical protein JWQ49_4083 [Edaphobacter sp.]|nr:hypothetical protein [Edaphobacter sp.]
MYPDLNQLQRLQQLRWLALFDNHLDKDSVQAGQQANLLSKNSSFADLHNFLFADHPEVGLSFLISRTNVYVFTTVTARQR